MKVLMLTCNSSLLDGINRHILTIAPELNGRGEVEVAVCVTQPWGELCEALKSRGVEVYTLNAPHGHALPIVWRFWRVMREFRPDVVHAHVMSLLVGLVLRWGFRSVRCVATVHGIGDPQPRRPLKDFLGKVVRVVTGVRFVHTCYISEGVRRFFGGGEHSSVVYNPIPMAQDLFSKEECLRRLGVPEGCPVIGTACRFSEQKNPLAFTRVMCQVLCENPSAHAVVLGDGEEPIKVAMREEVAKHGCEARFHFLGYRPDTPQLVRGFDCFVMTSHWEGLPTALLEAMAMKTPIAFLEGGGD